MKKIVCIMSLIIFFISLLVSLFFINFSPIKNKIKNFNDFKFDKNSEGQLAYVETSIEPIYFTGGSEAYDCSYFIYKDINSKKENPYVAISIINNMEYYRKYAKGMVQISKNPNIKTIRWIGKIDIVRPYMKKYVDGSNFTVSESLKATEGLTYIYDEVAPWLSDELGYKIKKEDGKKYIGIMSLDIGRNVEVKEMKDVALFFDKDLEIENKRGNMFLASIAILIAAISFTTFTVTMLKK